VVRTNNSFDAEFIKIEANSDVVGPKDSTQ
jgi:hypothetical protein